MYPLATNHLTTQCSVNFSNKYKTNNNAILKEQQRTKKQLKYTLKTKKLKKKKYEQKIKCKKKNTKRDINRLGNEQK